MKTIEMLKEEIKEVLLNDDNMLISTVGELNSWNGSFDYLEYWENDEEFFNLFFHSNPMEVARAITYGEYNYTDDYVKFNAYGNLVSADKWDIVKEMQDEIEEIVESIIEESSNLCLDSEIQDLIDEYEESEEEEE
nr:MAG TPA: hypothetical protein [Caudoviricetes sp.]